MATTNLTSKQITTWKNSVDTAISQNLVGTLSSLYDIAGELAKVTSSGQDENNLNYRFNDLKKVMTESASQLSKFMNAFDEDLANYIYTVKKAENALDENVRKAIDQFAEAATAISKLSM